MAMHFNCDAVQDMDLSKEWHHGEEKPDHTLPLGIVYPAIDTIRVE